MLIQEFYNQYLPYIEQRLNGPVDIDSQHPSVREIISYHFRNSGKCLRSYLATSLSQCFMGKVSENDLDFAASVELIHNASLIHDDLQDHDFYRRGELNVWKKYSPSQAINMGDLLLTKSLERILSSSMTADTQLVLVRRMVTAINELIHGQMLEISFQHTTNMSWQDWENVAAQKTGALLRLIFEGTLLISGVDISKCGDELNSLGRALGNIYQMRDDLLDASGYKEGRLQGSDILEGKMTCLSIKALETNPDILPIIAESLTNKNNLDDTSRIAPVINLYDEMGSITLMKEHYARHVELCCRHAICRRYPAIEPVLSDFLELLKFDAQPHTFIPSPSNERGK